MRAPFASAYRTCFIGLFAKVVGGGTLRQEKKYLQFCSMGEATAPTGLTGKRDLATDVEIVLEMHHHWIVIAAPRTPRVTTKQELEKTITNGEPELIFAKQNRVLWHVGHEGRDKKVKIRQSLGASIMSFSVSGLPVARAEPFPIPNRAGPSKTSEGALRRIDAY